MTEAWSAEAVTELKNRVWSDQAITRIAQRMGRTDSAVRQKATELGLKRPKFWNQQRVKTCKDLYAKGLSSSQIGKVIGVTRNSVIGLVHRRGWSRPEGATIQLTRDERTARRRQIYAERAVFKLDYEDKTEPAAERPETRVSLADLDELNHCRWPFGDPPVLMYCGAQKVDGCSYCSWHRRIAFQPKYRRAA